MIFKINHKLLWDSTYNSESRELFATGHKEFKNLVQDIKNGNPTCYLISGYRGAGKSSFIKRIETEIENELKKEKSEEAKKNQADASSAKEIIFVYTNFGKYHNQSHLLRKLIRGLYLKVKDLESFKKTKKDEIKKEPDNRPAHLLEQLFDKTFYDTSTNQVNTNKKERVTLFNIDVTEFLSAVIPLFLFAFFVLNTAKKWVGLPELANYAGIILSLITGIKGFLKINLSRTNTKSQQEDFNRKSMYDDEIADHHFFYMLHAFDTRYKVVFVLDELDKMEDKEMDKLLNEMKPYLVSGAASFIVVAGQDLYYKYTLSKSQDDALLSSMFSKCIHIPLLSREEFQSLFTKLLVHRPITVEEYQIFKGYVDYLVFQSKRIPRKFISLIRENLTWDNDTAFLQIDELIETYLIYTKLLNAIDSVDEREIAVEGLDDGIIDFFVMQLFLECHQIFFSKETTFTLDEIIKKHE